ncbi:cytochrome-c peroxidase [Taibaiella koreensis]|uniref:cytochrome-c peroxidase n=1 Tax=Taibaiella koreensis TaxID=1268548 RepID=UPI0019691EEC|nr:cytochrome c peroxidase [Taibaiella koreensis]
MAKRDLRALMQPAAAGMFMKQFLRWALVCCAGVFLAYTLSALKVNKAPSDPWAAHCLSQFLSDARSFSTATSDLKTTVNDLSAGDTASLTHARQALLRCRLSYKKIEYFMEYFFAYPVNLYNRAPVHEIEEPYMEYQSPVGLQLIEDLLYGEDPFAQKQALQEQAAVVQSTAADIPASVYGFEATGVQVAESLSQELIRVMALGIAGYDAPVCKSGLPESAVALQSVKAVLAAKTAGEQNLYADSCMHYLDKAIVLLQASTGFDTFDRLSLLTDALLPAQEYLNRYCCQQYPGIGGEGAYNYNARHLFRPDALRQAAFDRLAQSDTAAGLVALGKLLFSDNRLSGDNTRSCATCHKPSLYFSDGLKGSPTIGNGGSTRRNAPSLLYSSYQYGQFLDARDASLEKQIYTVLQNPDEMHSRLDDVVRKLDNKTYRPLLRKAFSQAGKQITPAMIARAIAAYERSLSPFNSAFDRYINGDHNAMNVSQRRGFNLFMGKALCGTCHFAPLFNGTLPPLFNRTELEVLGTPDGGSLDKPVPDTDSGRFGIFPIEFYQYAFKTPTVRNAGETAPYMHNGSFTTLEDLIEFYNRGGGAGIGLEVPTQTLSPRKLNLSQAEIADLKSFMLALKDSL